MWQWKKLNEDLEEKDLLKVRLAEIEKNPAPPPTNKLEIFLWGLLAGSTTVLLVEKFGSK